MSSVVIWDESRGRPPKLVFLGQVSFVNGIFFNVRLKSGRLPLVPIWSSKDPSDIKEGHPLKLVFLGQNVSFVNGIFSVCGNAKTFNTKSTCIYYINQSDTPIIFRLQTNGYPIE